MTSTEAASLQSHPLSTADPSGRLCESGEKLYRVINPIKQELYRRLFKDGTIEDLCKKGLIINTSIETDSPPESLLILEHRRLPVVSYAFEWSSEMLRAAALHVIDLELELLKKGLSLQDCHPWNVLFEGTKPQFVDFGSIQTEKGNDIWEANGEFFRYYVYPLMVLATPHHRIVRHFLTDHWIGITQLEADFLTSRASSEAKEKIRTLVRRIRKLLPSGSLNFFNSAIKSVEGRVTGRSKKSTESRSSYLTRLRTMVEGLPNFQADTYWSAYAQDEYPDFSPSATWTEKHRQVHAALTKLQPKTLLDIASNTGWYSILAAKMGIQVIATDNDETCINQLFREARRLEANVHPLYGNLLCPSPAIGTPGTMMPAAVDRLRSECVLALAITHHMVFRFFFSLDQIVNLLNAFSSRYLIVEFVPKEDKYVSGWWDASKPWYSLEAFRNSLGRFFDNIVEIPSHPSPRVLLICEKKKP